MAYLHSVAEVHLQILTRQCVVWIETSILYLSINNIYLM